MPSFSLRVLVAAGLFSSVAFAPLALAIEPQPPATTSPRFDIRAFKVEGNSLLPQQEIDRLVQPYTGSGRDFGDVQRALEALQAAYQALGYSSVQVILPEQELEQGVVQLKVIEQHVASITVEGNEYYDDTNVLQAVPSLQAGTLPNMKAVQKNLKVANENPSRQTAVLFKNNDNDESVIDATVKVIDDKPWKAFLTLDNTGSRETGQSRIGFGYQNYNLFGKDHRVTVQYITNLHYPNAYFNPTHKVNILGGAYTIPFYEWGDSLDMLAGYSDVSTGKIAGGLLTVSGKGLILGAHYNHNLARIQDYDHKITVGMDYRAYRSDVGTGGVNLTPHVTAAPFSLNYAGIWQKEDQQLSFNVGGNWNLVSGMTSHGGADDYGAGGSNSYRAENDFSKYSYGVDYIRPFAKNWQLHLALNGQLATDHLIPGEQFRIGGMDSVRGWHESVISGDKGYRLSIEAISPDFGARLGDKIGMRGLFFFDQGHIRNNKDVTGASLGSSSPEITIASIGAGLRGNYGKDFVARADYAVVVDPDTTTVGTTKTHRSREPGDMFMHVSLGWIW